MHDPSQQCNEQIFHRELVQTDRNDCIWEVVNMNRNNNANHKSMVSEDLTSASTRGQVECEAQRQDDPEFLDTLWPAVSFGQFPQVQGSSDEPAKGRQADSGGGHSGGTGKGDHLLAA